MGMRIEWYAFYTVLVQMCIIVRHFLFYSTENNERVYLLFTSFPSRGSRTRSLSLPTITLGTF